MLNMEVVKWFLSFVVCGHDSKEDASACMELMMWKLREDAKKAARK